MIPEAKRKDLEKQGYRIVGNHSAIKVCLWCKKAIRGQDVCYKETFYNIKSHQCVQMTPALQFCSHRCSFCWRDIGWTKPKFEGPIDDPKEIVDGCIKEHVKFLQGFGGFEGKNKQKFEEAMHPKHFAISLSGEPCLYPKLPELIEEIKSRGMTAYLVTNGTQPEMIKKLINHPPTNFYITVPAPDKATYLKVCAPIIDDGWDKIQESLSQFKNFKDKTKRIIRLTVSKDLNMINPEGYANLLKDVDFDYLEVKAYVFVGHSQERMTMENMPRHHEIKEFAEQLAKLLNLKIKDEKQESRVVLLEH
ncbi:4-demethylwyosine synthase TYW1 [Nanoarchaeota archaeon]